MMYHEGRNIVIKTPMKCGSTTLETALRDLNEGWWQIMGPHPWQATEIDKHTDCVPHNAKHYRAKQLLLIRHPVARVASFYNHHRQWGGELSPDDWFDKVFPTPFCCPATELYGFDSVIRLEFLQEDLARHGIHVGKLPKCNVSPERFTLTDEQEELVYDRHATDLAAFLEMTLDSADA